MKPEELALLAGFVGTLIGAAVSILTVWIQQRHQARQDRARLAMEAAIKELESAETYARFMAEQGQRIATLPLAYYVALHNGLIELLAKGKTITREEWLAAHRKADELGDATMAHYNEKEKAMSDKKAQK